MRTVVILINQYEEYQVQFLMDGQLHMQHAYQAVGVAMANDITRWLEEGLLS